MAVPTHLYKVILAETDDTSAPASLPPLPPTLGVFVVPNRPLGDEELTTFQTTLSDLETLSGISFHSKLDRSQVWGVYRGRFSNTYSYSRSGTTDIAPGIVYNTCCRHFEHAWDAHYTWCALCTLL